MCQGMWTHASLLAHALRESRVAATALEGISNLLATTFVVIPNVSPGLPGWPMACNQRRDMRHKALTQTACYAYFFPNQKVAAVLDVSSGPTYRCRAGENTSWMTVNGRRLFQKMYWRPQKGPLWPSICSK